MSAGNRQEELWGQCCLGRSVEPSPSKVTSGGLNAPISKKASQPAENRNYRTGEFLKVPPAGVCDAPRRPGAHAPDYEAPWSIRRVCAGL